MHLNVSVIYLADNEPWRKLMENSLTMAHNENNVILLWNFCLEVNMFKGVRWTLMVILVVYIGEKKNRRLKIISRYLQLVSIQKGVKRLISAFRRTVI